MGFVGFQLGPGWSVGVVEGGDCDDDGGGCEAMVMAVVAAMVCVWSIYLSCHMPTRLSHCGSCSPRSYSKTQPSPIPVWMVAGGDCGGGGGCGEAVMVMVVGRDGGGCCGEVVVVISIGGGRRSTRHYEQVDDNLSTGVEARTETRADVSA